jgi:anti-anti-sigma factor
MYNSCTAHNQSTLKGGTVVDRQVRTLDYLTVTVEPAEGDHSTVVRVSGELDMLTASVLEQVPEEVGTATSLLVDLSQVSFLGASGLAVLGRGITRAERAHRDFRTSTPRLPGGRTQGGRAPITAPLADGLEPPVPARRGRPTGLTG